MFSLQRKDHFKIVHFGEYFGRIKKLRIGHDNSGLGPAWYLKKVNSRDMYSIFNIFLREPCGKQKGDREKSIGMRLKST